MIKAPRSPLSAGLYQSSGARLLWSNPAFGRSVSAHEAGDRTRSAQVHKLRSSSRRMRDQVATEVSWIAAAFAQGNLVVRSVRYFSCSTLFSPLFGVAVGNRFARMLSVATKVLRPRIRCHVPDLPGGTAGEASSLR